MDDDLGQRLVDLLGVPACVELFAVLELPRSERATLIGQLHASERGRTLAEVLADVEADPDDSRTAAGSRGAA